MIIPSDGLVCTQHRCRYSRSGFLEEHFVEILLFGVYVMVVEAVSGACPGSVHEPLQL